MHLLCAHQEGYIKVRVRIKLNEDLEKKRCMKQSRFRKTMNHVRKKSREGKCFKLSSIFDVYYACDHYNHEISWNNLKINPLQLHLSTEFLDNWKKWGIKQKLLISFPSPGQLSSAENQCSWDMHGGGSEVWTATTSPPHPSVSRNELPTLRTNLTQTNKYTPRRPSPSKLGGCCIFRDFARLGYCFNGRKGTQYECAHTPITAFRD